MRCKNCNSDKIKVRIGKAGYFWVFMCLLAGGVSTYNGTWDLFSLHNLVCIGLAGIFYLYARYGKIRTYICKMCDEKWT